MTLKEKAKEIRKQLKEKGITSKQVSVRSSHAGYSQDIRVSIKDLSVNYELVSNIANKFESISRD